MACNCGKSQSGTWEIVNADSTVRPDTYATMKAAQDALVAAGGGGFVRARTMAKASS